MTDDATPEPPLDAEMDAALRDAYAFAPAAAEEAAAKFRLPAPRAARWPWLLLPAAAAAGIGIGFLLAPERTVVVETRLPTIGGRPHIRTAGFVALATKPLGGPGGRTFVAGNPILEGETVEVPGNGRASLILSDGSEIRLDRGTRLTLQMPPPLPDPTAPLGVVGTSAGGRGIDLLQGRVWSRVSKGDPFLLGAGETRVTVLGTELSVSRTEKGTGVQLFSGSARVEAAGVARDLAAGQEVEFEDGKLSDVRKVYSEAIATGWMLELHAYAGRHDRDLAEHMDRMLSEMGRRKMAHLEEEAIVKDLGPVCRVPVARFLVSESARTETEARRKAARVLEKIADASVASELVTALRDPDAEVRVSAAMAIRRVSDGAACPEPEAFRASCDEAAASAADAWAKSRSPPAGGD